MLKKNELKKFIPPVILEQLKKFIKARGIAELNAKEFVKWWHEFKATSPLLPQNLILMVDYFITTPSFEETSNYWNYLNKLNIEALYKHGIENFKQTIEKNN